MKLHIESTPRVPRAKPDKSEYFADKECPMIDATVITMIHL